MRNRKGERITVTDTGSPHPHPWPVQQIVVDERHLITPPWLLALQRVGRKIDDQPPGGEAGLGIRHRTLLLKDTTVGDDIADHVTAYADGTAQRFTGVLRKPISSDLTVRVNINGDELIVITIPAATAVDSPVESTAFNVTTGTDIEDNDVFTWDVVDSDGNQDKNGIASFTLEWL